MTNRPSIPNPPPLYFACLLGLCVALPLVWLAELCGWRGSFVSDTSPTFPTRAEFEEWLRAHRPRQPVGTRYSTCGCPVARYLRDHGYPRAVVGALTWSPEFRLAASFDLPDWATRFTCCVDESGEQYSDITAGKALRLLAEVLEK